MMHKYILSLLFLGVLSAARGQTYWHYDYWFDNNFSTLKTGTNGNGSNSFQIDADVSTLGEGLHTINIQAKGYSNVITGFEKVDVVDEDYQNVMVTTEKQELYSVPVTHYFVKMPESTTARCWFDNDDNTLQKAVNTGEPLLLDVKGLKDGFHILNVQAEGADKGVSITKCYPFVKIPQVLGVDRLTCLCMIDDQLYKQESVSANNGVVAWNFDVSSLPQGFHRIFVQMVTPSGAATALYQGFFFRETTKTEFGEMKCVYAIDGGHFDNVAGMLTNGTFHFDLDVSKLSDGLHRIAYMLSNGKGVTTKVQTQFFTKIPLGGYGTVEYWYWLNDQDGDGEVVKVKVDPRKNPFSVSQLLPVAQVPLRSSQFAFSFENGKPVIYAKNTFHARFYDASGRFVDLNKDYVDERVKLDVDLDDELVVEALNAPALGTMRRAAENVKQTQFAKPGVNGIKWFTVKAEAGDSLQFRLDRAATVQLFSPTGKEVYSVMGADAVKWGGIHAEENGTYYLGVHDVTASNGGNLTLYYELIDKYAVLRQDINTVGNGGPSTITFFGNGYDKLTKVSLKLGSTTLNSVKIGHEANATTSVKFDFGGAPLGQYDAIFHFEEKGTGEDITIEQCITVEQAVPVFIDGYVSYAPQFLVARGNDYDFRLTNHGNQTAYDVPMTLLVYTTEAENLERITLDGTVLDDFVVATELPDDAPEGFSYLRTYNIMRTLKPSSTESCIVNVLTTGTDAVCVILYGIGGTSQPVNSLDPNDIYGYLDENGTKFVKPGHQDVYYTIEFENDPAFATAPAHDIWVTDQLDATLFDFATYKPTRIQIGEKSVELDGSQNFVTTIDMRPQINAIALVEGTFDAEKGEVKWHISSLDPMTVEPTTEPMDGVLPVNADGNGIGKLSFDILLKAGLEEGTKVPNQADIKFDANEVITTPTWTNIIGVHTPASGDANSDGVVNYADVIAIVNYILGNDVKGFDKDAADMDRNEKITVTDAVMVFNKLQQP